MSTPVWWSHEIGDGDSGRDVTIVQRKLGLLPTGHADAAFSLVVRGFQKGVGLHATGYVDGPTAQALGEQEGFGLLPAWWTGLIYPGETGYAYVLTLLGADGVDAVKRFQGNHRLAPTGVIDETTARLLAGLEVEL